MICFAWNEFPQYAARCIGAYVQSSDERVVVVATKPKVPILGMELLARCNVVWVTPNDLRPLLELCGDIPRILIVSGWAVRCFNRYRDEVRCSGGKVISMVDNNYRYTLKEIIKAIRFRIMFQRKYDGFIVPGNSGLRLLQFYGVPKEKVRIGMYAADNNIFKDGKQLSARVKKIIYVGQLIKRKNIIRMCEVFQCVNDGTWELELYGCGVLRNYLIRQDFKNIRL